MPSPKELAQQARLVIQSLTIFADMLEGTPTTSPTTPIRHTTQEKPVRKPTPEYDDNPASPTYDPSPPMDVVRVPPRETPVIDKPTIREGARFECIYCKQTVLVAGRDVYNTSEPGRGLSLEAFRAVDPGIEWPPSTAVKVNRVGGISIPCPLCNQLSAVWLDGSPPRRNKTINYSDVGSI